MGIETKAAIDIAAPREEVFRWVTERDKLTSWMGGAGAMPEDPAQLAVGFTAAGTMPSPGGDRPTTLTVTAWNPPSTFGCTITYDGGDSISVYTLTETATGTRLELASDTDFARADLSGVEKAIAGQTEAAQDMIEDQLERMQEQLAAGAFDAGVQPQMQKSVEDSLAKLKGLIEAG
jgi:uncharacterized protein YndB with AHSA1/START domain